MKKETIYCDRCEGVIENLSKVRVVEVEEGQPFVPEGPTRWRLVIEPERVLEEEPVWWKADLCRICTLRLVERALQEREI